MNSRPILENLDELRLAMKAGNVEKVQSITFDLDMSYLGHQIPEGDFSLMLNLLGEKVVSASRHSSDYVHFFQSRWPQITKQQRELLLPKLERLFRITADWMSCFTISEMLGEEFRNKASFSAAKRLARIKKPKNRAFVPHIFEHLSTDSKDPDVRRKAKIELVRMKADSFKQVRREVQISIRRIKRRERLKFTSDPYMPRIDSVYPYAQSEK